MAGEEEEVVLRFTVKGSEVSVKQISQVTRATEKLDTSTTKSTKRAGDAWDRYQRSTSQSLSNIARRMGAPDVVADHLADRLSANLVRMTAAWRTHGTQMTAQAYRAGTEAAIAYERGLATGGGLSGGLGGRRGGGGGLGSGLAGGMLGRLSTAGRVALGAGGAATLGVGALVGWGMGGMQGASDQNEARNRVDVLYGTGANERVAPTTGSFGDRNRIAKTMGLSNTEYLQTYGALSSQLLGAGMTKPEADAQAKKLLQGMVDMSSITNLSNEEAATGIQGILRGENEPAERLGVMLNQSVIDVSAKKMFGKATNQLTPGQQVQARLAALQGSAGWAQAQGDFQRSLPTSLENQKKAAAATTANTQQRMGELLNRLVEALLPLVDPLMNVLDWVITALKPVIAALGSFLGAATGSTTIKSDDGKTSVTMGGLQGMAVGVVDAYRKGNIGVSKEVAPGISTGISLGAWGRASGGMVPGWSPGIDNHLVPLSGGEGVLTPETVAMMGGANAINGLNLAGLRRRGGYANGTAAASVNAMMGGGGARAKGFASGIYVPGSPTQASDSTTTAPGGVTAEPAGEGVYPADAFLALTQRIMTEKGMDPSQAWMLLEQAKHESSLRVNPPVPDDVNMHNGAGGSWGILQFIKDTFASYADPGHTNFLGVEDQIRAALNYVPARYGGPGIGYLERNGFGPYDSGGWLQPGVTQTVNKTGKPEAVLTEDQWSTMKSLAGGGGGSGVNVTIQAIHIGVGAGGGDLASTITDELGDAIAARINRANDRRL